MALCSAVATQLSAQEIVLFKDTFDRPDNTNVNANLPTGQSGQVILPGGLTYTKFGGLLADSVKIDANRLSLAASSKNKVASAAPIHSFTEYTNFSVTFEVDLTNLTFTTANGRGFYFSIGDDGNFSEFNWSRTINPENLSFIMQEGGYWDVYLPGSSSSKRFTYLPNTISTIQVFVSTEGFYSGASASYELYIDGWFTDSRPFSWGSVGNHIAAGVWGQIPGRIDSIEVATGKTPPPQAEGPNIVIIYADDLGYGDLTCYNSNALVPTPSIDRLANEGIRFSQGYVACSVCYPSRVGLMTGANPAWNNVLANTPAQTIPEEQKLIPEIMRPAGYSTGLVGKWNEVKVQNPRSMFDEVYNLIEWKSDYWPGGDCLIWGPANPEDVYITDAITNSACDFIDRHKNAPFFLHLAYNAPHTPLQAKIEYQDEVAHLPSEPLRVYAAMLLSLDEGVGRVLAALDRNGLTNKTLVAFVSDNGPATGGAGLECYQVDWPEVLLGSVGPLRGNKSQLYEGGIRVPFILRYPGVLPAGVVDDRMVTNLDLLPTCSALAEAQIPTANFVHGRNLLPYLTGETIGQPHDTLYWAEGDSATRTVTSGVIRDGDWKLHVKHNGGVPAIHELYNLASDLDESDNLSSQNADKAQELLKKYQGWFQSIGAHHPRSFSDWAVLYGLTGPDAEPNARPLGDLDNLLKFAFRLPGDQRDRSTLVPSTGTSGLPVLIADSQGSPDPHWTFEFIRRRDGSLNYLPMVSQNLIDYTPSTTPPSITPIDADWERVTIPHPIGENPVPLFMRVDVETAY